MSSSPEYLFGQDGFRLMDALAVRRVTTLGLPTETADSDSLLRVEGAAHMFATKTFTRATFCSDCKELIWGLSQQGLACGVCGWALHPECYQAARDSHPQQLLTCQPTSLQSVLMLPSPVLTPPLPSSPRRSSPSPSARYASPEQRRDDASGLHRRTHSSQLGESPSCTNDALFTHRRSHSSGVAVTLAPDSPARQHGCSSPGRQLSQEDSDLRVAFCAYWFEQHHWTWGNLPTPSANCTCCVCGKKVTNHSYESGVRCSRCRVVVHPEHLTDVPLSSCRPRNFNLLFPGWAHLTYNPPSNQSSSSSQSSSNQSSSSSQSSSSQSSSSQSSSSQSCSSSSQSSSIPTSSSTTMRLHQSASLVVPSVDDVNEQLLMPSFCDVSLVPSYRPTINNVEFSPLLVFVNSRSGGGQGQELLRKFRQRLGPVQVFDLNRGGPEPGLLLFEEVPNLRILVCGGDGTVGWVLSALDANPRYSDPHRRPPVAVLPLGTGNDLSRTLGWGPGYEGDESMGLLLAQLAAAPVVSLDRWKLTMSGGRQFVMNNYFSLGVDAKVALGFHTLREEIPELFSSRLGNKVIYAINGLKAALESSTLLTSAVELLEAGIRIPLPPDIEGLIFLNLPSYAGGAADLWGSQPDDDDDDDNDDDDDGDNDAGKKDGALPADSDSPFSLFSCVSSLSESPSSRAAAPVHSLHAGAAKPARTRARLERATRRRFRRPAINDSMIEVAGITGSFHMGTITASLTNAIRIAQAREITIVIKQNALDLALPFQVDGEPASLTPGDQHIHIRPHSQARMLSAPTLPADMKKLNPIRLHPLTDEDTDSPDRYGDPSQHELGEHHGTPIEGEFMFW